MRFSKKYVLLTVLLIAGLTLGIYFSLLPQAVKVAIPKKDSIIQRVSGPGNLEADVSVQVSPRISGIIEELKVKEGDTVSNDQVLAVLDDSDRSARVNVARSRLEEARLAVLSARVQRLYHTAGKAIGFKGPTEEDDRYPGALPVFAGHGGHSYCLPDGLHPDHAKDTGDSHLEAPGRTQHHYRQAGDGTIPDPDPGWICPGLYLDFPGGNRPGSVPEEPGPFAHGYRSHLFDCACRGDSCIPGRSVDSPAHFPVRGIGVKGGWLCLYCNCPA